MEDRELVPLSFFEDGSRESLAARDRFGIEGGSFCAILIGKDGTGKFRSPVPVRPGTLFELIDAMPMRRRERRERGGHRG